MVTTSRWRTRWSRRSGGSWRSSASAFTSNTRTRYIPSNQCDSNANALIYLTSSFSSLSPSGHLFEDEIRFNAFWYLFQVIVMYLKWLKEEDNTALLQMSWWVNEYISTLRSAYFLASYLIRGWKKCPTLEFLRKRCTSLPLYGRCVDWKMSVRILSSNQRRKSIYWTVQCEMLIGLASSKHLHLSQYGRAVEASWKVEQITNSTIS